MYMLLNCLIFCCVFCFACRRSVPNIISVFCFARLRSVPNIISVFCFARLRSVPNIISVFYFACRRSVPNIISVFCFLFCLPSLCIQYNLCVLIVHILIGFRLLHFFSQKVIENSPTTGGVWRVVSTLSSRIVLIRSIVLSFAFVTKPHVGHVCKPKMFIKCIKIMCLLLFVQVQK